MPFFICPSCAYRERSTDRNVRHQPRGCSRCGFGFLFELLEDYYAGPRTALVVCDKQRRILAAGHAAVAVTGYQEGELLGHELVERLKLRFEGDDPDPAAKSLEWGVRVLGVPCTYRPRGVDEDRPAVADFFPAYDDDGGLLLALAPGAGTATRREEG